MRVDTRRLQAVRLFSLHQTELERSPMRWSTPPLRLGAMASILCDFLFCCVEQTAFLVRKKSLNAWMTGCVLIFSSVFNRFSWV